MLRAAHNYLFRVKNNDYPMSDLELLNNYVLFKEDLPTYKVALLLVSVNQNYWQYAGQVIDDVKRYFLPGHKTDIFLWSDMPEIKEFKDISELEEKFKSETDPTKKQEYIFQFFQQYLDALYLGKQVQPDQILAAARNLGLVAQFQPLPNNLTNLILNGTTPDTPLAIAAATKELIRKQKQLQESVTKIEVEPIEWPYGTLLRYSMFLQEEEKLKDYDYIFYMDVDMRIVNVVGDEILGQGLTIAPHPGYFLRKELYPPYEPNDKSASFIKRPGKVVMMDGQPRFMPFYAAGGFQGGTATSYLKAMKETKKLIDIDLNKNSYIPIWNDETAWNKYVFDCQTKEEIEQTIFLTPSYIYPDSLIKEYYEKFWGQSYPPKIITLTKPFTVQKMDMSKFNTM